MKIVTTRGGGGMERGIVGEREWGREGNSDKEGEKESAGGTVGEG